MKKVLHHIDVFAGIGGFRAGLDLALGSKVKTVAFCENDERAVRTYRNAFDAKSETHVNDLCQATDKDVCCASFFRSKSVREKTISRVLAHFPACDLITAGCPCQPHSLMGNRMGLEDDRGALAFELVKLLYALRPRIFILENVRAFRSVNGGLLFQKLVTLLSEKCGYNVTCFTLNAADYGVPQVRRRLFICGHQSRAFPAEDPRLPKVTGLYPTAWHALERNVEDRYYLSEKILPTILKHQHKGYKRPAEINRLIARPITRTMHKLHRASQDNYYSDDFVHGRFDRDAFTVIRNTNFDCRRIRRITPREAFRLQSFPESMGEAMLASGNSDTQLYMQAGNAVPPNLVKHLASHLFRHERN